MRNFLIFSYILLFSTIAQSAIPPKIQLSTLYHQDINIQEYWISEKLDGVRAYWDGEKLISRQGNIFNCPQWFIDSFPTTPLDGELWIGRQQFEKVSSIVRKKKPNETEWRAISFMIFDLPTSTENFNVRIAKMKRIIKNTPSPYLKMIAQIKVQNNTELQALHEQVVKKGGEGLMLHRGSAYYQTKRSKDLMKLKKHQDAEATVIQHIPGKGRNSERLGALVLKTPEGITFKLGTGFSDAEREHPPEVGSTVTYKYFGKTKNGVPRFASFLRVREYY